jgi:hypothetical protein
MGLTKPEYVHVIVRKACDVFIWDVKTCSLLAAAVVPAGFWCVFVNDVVFETLL